MACASRERWLLAEGDFPPGYEALKAELTTNGHGRNAAGPNGTDLRFRFTAFRDIKPSTAPPYVVHEMIPRLGVVVIWGKPKCGKTFWTFDLEMHVALGWPYRGRRVEQGEVLHIACEGVAGLAARKEAWRLHHVKDRDAETIAQIEAAPFYLCKETALDLIQDVNKVVADIIVQFGGRPIKVITIDTLNRSLKGSESKDEDMTAYVRAAVLLAEKFQCVVIVIHHCGYDPTHPRGHTSLIGAVDADIEVKKDDKDKVCTEVKNMRDGANGAPTCSRLATIEVTRDDNGTPIMSCVIVPDDTMVEQPAGSKAKAKTPSPLGRQFYNALCSAGATQSIIREAAGGKASITTDQWTAQLDQARLLEPEAPADTGKEVRDRVRQKRSAKLSKYRGELIEFDWIRCNGDIVWSIRT
jgi:hypothetical protein